MDNCGITIIIPTFNEVQNIQTLIYKILNIFTNSGINGRILVVDDLSEDGTIDVLEKISKTNTNVKYIVRKKDPGLSQSVVEGFENVFTPYILVMDADLSHPPSIIPVFYDKLIDNQCDIVIGSRYIKNGSIENWPIERKIISYGGTFLGRILVPSVRDPVSGFFAFNRDVIANVKLKPRGYKILLEVLGKGNWETVIEIPFTFKDRELGKSKLKIMIIIDYLRQFFDIFVFKVKKLFFSQ